MKKGDPTLSQLILILVRALKQWKCPACGGKGKYMQRGWWQQSFVNELVTCTKCDGVGLHPTAFKALTEAGIEL
jgi:hypothetical protein